jgi:uroporphyrinogen decarboxylase
MTPRERILAVLNRQPVDRLPVDLWHTPEIGDLLRRHCGVADDLAMYRALGLDKIVWVFMDYRTEEGERAGSQSGAGAEDGGSRTMWGVPLKDIQAGEAHYAEFGAAPLAGYDTPESLDDYPWWPDVERFDYDGATAQAQLAAQDFAVIGPWVSLFEIYCQLRGLEQSLMDLVEAPELVEAILDRVEQIQTEMMRRFFRRAGKSLDLVFISDDIAGQTSLLMSPILVEAAFRAAAQALVRVDSRPWIAGFLPYGRSRAPPAGTDSRLRRRCSQPDSARLSGYGSGRAQARVRPSRRLSRRRGQSVCAAARHTGGRSP